jgi:hypothetical protein
MTDTIPQIYCKKCDTFKPITDFYDAGHQQHLPPEDRRKQKPCKTCALNYKKRNREKINETRKKCVSEKGKNGYIASKRKHHLRVKYGITMQDYTRMLQEQNGVCAICKQPESRVHPVTKNLRQLAVDHDHKTGKIRGLLCNRCNILLGFIEDENVSQVEYNSFVDYLKK